MPRDGRPPDPDINDDRPIKVPGLSWEPEQRLYLKTAIECAEGMHLWWLKAETAKMRKELDD